MARADLLKKLFTGFSTDNKQLFLDAARKLIEEERQKRHTALANDLEMMLTAKSTNHKQLTNYEIRSTTSFNQENKTLGLVDIIYPQKYFEDAVLSQEIILQLKEIIVEFQNWAVLESNGVSPSNKILFYGPPGCGKTLSANILAGEIGIPLMYVRFDALISSYLGETATNIAKIFEMAKNNNYVVLFDEFDAIGRSREADYEHGEMRRVVNAFLQQLDNFRGQSIVIAATNYEQSLDYAIWRRFDDTVEFKLPSFDEQQVLFSVKLNLFRGPVLQYKKFQALTKDFSYADVENVCKRIIRSCVLRGSRIYSLKDIQLSVLKQNHLVTLRNRK